MAQGKRRRSAALGWKEQKETVRVKKFFQDKKPYFGRNCTALKK
jgi:hypothetical protein